MFANRGKKEDGKNKKNATLCSCCYYFLSNYTGDHSSYIDTWTARENEWFHELRGDTEPFTLADNFFGRFLRRFGCSHCFRCEQNLSVKIALWEQVKPVITDSQLHQSYACSECMILLHFPPSFLMFLTCFGAISVAECSCENWCSKRAGVTGIALRVSGNDDRG